MSSFICKYYATDTTTPIKLKNESNTSNIQQMLVDGVSVTPSSEYTFSSIGEHEVEFKLVFYWSTFDNSYFQDCTGLTEVTLYDKVTSVGMSCFEGCTSLRKVTIPSNVTSLGNRIFYGCTSLEEVNMPSTITSLPKYCFYNCTSLNMDIPSHIQSFGEECFAGCTSLYSITIPNGVKELPNGCFRNCKNLSNVILPEGLEKWYSNTFTGTNIKSIVLPSTLNSWYGIVGLQSVNVPTGITRIPWGGYQYLDMESFNISNNITELGEYSFAYSELEAITMSDNVTTIGSRSFFYCRSLKNVYLSKSLTNIKPYTFAYCTALEEITIPASVTSIGDRAFTNCSNLKSITFEGTVAPSTNLLIVNMFEGVPETGTLYVPYGSDYSEYLNSGGALANWEVVYTGAPIDPSEEYFWVELEEDGIVGGIGVADTDTPIRYSYDGNVWDIALGNESCYANQKIYFKNIDEYWPGDRVTFSKRGKIGGPLSSLGAMKSFAFNEMFEDNSNLTSAAELILDYDHVDEYAFQRMFRYCTSLVDAPQLPATTLANNCYQHMFSDCHSLVNPPVLPATVMAESCYDHMFYGCNFTTAPELPSTTLAKSCYESMFSYCEKLVNPPVLPATVMAENCYENMFYFCSSLTKAPELPATTLAKSCYSSMFFTCRKLTEAPELPATILAENCYNNMFNACQALDTAPVLPSTTLVKGCYSTMFFMCSSLNYIKMLATDISAEACMDRWVAYVAESGTFVKAPSANIPINNENGIPVGWTIYNNGENEPLKGKINNTTIYTSYEETTRTLIVNQVNVSGWKGFSMIEGEFVTITSYDFATASVVFHIDANNSRFSRTSRIKIIGYDINNDIVEGIITIEQEANENVKTPEINVTPINLEFDSNGATKTVTVEYYSIYTIFAPITTKSWVTVEEVSRDYRVEYGVRIDIVTYNITVPRTINERSARVVFTGADEMGDEYSNDYLHIYQEQAEAMPQPSIFLSKTQMALDESGSSSNVQVTYINIENVIEPEAVIGLSIEEIERVDGEDGLQVKYKITRTTSNKIDTQIVFSGEGIDGTTATSTPLKITGKGVSATVELISIWPNENGVFYIGKDGNDSSAHLRVHNPTAPYTMEYTIRDENGVISCTDVEFYDYVEEDGYADWEYTFETLENNTNEPFTGTIDFTFKDGNTNETISVPFYVKYRTEGDIHPMIERYKYDKDGKNLNTGKPTTIDIGYTRMKNILPFECDFDWINIGEGASVGSYGTEGVKYSYPISVQPNAGASRVGYVTFNAEGIDGKNYSYDVEVQQEGTDVVKPIDEGFIELQTLSVTLTGVGGSETFKVKYYDAQTIYEPQLEFDWATITEIDRTDPVPDVAWNGEECDSVMVTYKVTAQSTDSGRQMKVKFSSDINYYDGGTIYMEKDKFIVYQLADGSSEVQGDLRVLRYSNSYTYYGTPNGFSPEVGYKDLAPDSPIFSESWCRVGSIKDKNSSEYDIIRTYELDVDTNNSPLSRTCTVTFIGNAEDGTQVKASYTFTQQGQDEVINEGVYDNYKGYFMDFNGEIHSVSFITNPRSDVYGDIRLAGDSPVVVSYTESDKLYDPIRTSNCTVRVVSSHYLMNLYTGKAHGTRVVLKNEDKNTIEWCGFLQPNLYNQGFTDCYEVIEFEASDCLSSLQYFKYEYYYNGNGQPMIVTFKNIIDSIFDRCQLIDKYTFTQKLYTNSEESKAFDFKDFYISENNFYSEEGEPWSFQEVLEEVCKYFGFVCFQWGSEVFFLDYDKFTENKSMTGYSYSKDNDWYQKTTKTISTSNKIVEESYRGSGSDISLDDVFNRVTVNCNYYNVEDLIPDLFEDDSLTERNGITITTLANHASEIGSKTSYITYDHKNIISHFYKPIVGTSVHEMEVTPTEEEFQSREFFKTFVGANIVDMYHLNYSDLTGRAHENKGWERYLMISQLNRPWCQGVLPYQSQSWETYNIPIMEFTNLPQIFIDNNEEVFTSNSGSTGGRVPVSRSTTNNRGIGSSSTTPRGDRDNTVNVNKSKNFLVIKAEAAFSPNFDTPYIAENADPKGFGKKSNATYGGYTYDQIRGNGNNTNITPGLAFFLEIPQKGWWNGREWVDYETAFEVPLEEADYLKDIWFTYKNVENIVDTNLFLGTTGYKIQLPSEMESTAFMQLKIGLPKRFAHILNSSGGDDTGKAGNAYCFIKNLEIKIVSRNTALMKDEDLIYENTIDDANVIDGPEINLKITSDNNITYSFSTVSTKYNDKPTTNFRFYDMNGELIKPEEAIIEKYVNQYSTPSLKENVTLDMSFKPTQLITDSYWNKDFVVVGQEIDYKMCAQTLTLLEKK